MGDALWPRTAALAQHSATFFDNGAPPASVAPAAPPPSTSYLIDSDFTITVGQDLEFASNGSLFPKDFFLLLDGGASQHVTLTNYGTIGATSSFANDVVLGIVANYDPALFDNFGNLTVTATGSAQTAVGLEGPDVVNEAAGRIVVQGSRAIGLEFDSTGFVPIVNHGYIEVDGGTPGPAPAVYGLFSAENIQQVVLNSGTFVVHGVDGAVTTGMAFGIGSFGTLTNTGTIHVYADSNNDQSIGLAYETLGGPTLINQGDINAGSAIEAYGKGGYGWGPAYLYNSGTIEGRVLLSEFGSAATGYFVFNSGTITGDVYLGTDYFPNTDASGEASTFDGRGGTLHGSVFGGDGNDTIYDGSGSNTLSGGRGDDILAGGPGNDTLDGGAGNDTASAFDAPAAVVMSLVANQVTGAGSGTDTLVGIENLEGSNYNDTLTGDSNANVLTGGGGDDLLNGGGGADTASYHDAPGGVMVSLLIASAQNVGGGSGSDTFVSIENLEGSAFADSLTGDGANNVLSGLGGNDVLIGGAGNDTLDGGAGTDTANYAGASGALSIDLGNSAAQNVGGGQGLDTFIAVENLIGSPFNDTLTGDGNDNVFTGGVGNDTLNGGGGNDTANYADATSAVAVDLNIAGTPQNVGGGDGSDTLNSIENVIGSNFNDTLLGDGTNNVLTGNQGDDVLNGGGGIDTASYAFATGGVTVDLNIAGVAQNVGGGEGSDTLIGIENVIGSEHDDVLIAGAATTNMNGGGGNDLLAGKMTGQTLDGGAGSDTVDYSNASNTLIVDLNQQSGVTNAHIILGGGSEVLLNIENLYGSAFGDVLFDNSSDNTFWGQGGNDDFSMGRGGNDTVFGGDGDDTITYNGHFTVAAKLDGGTGNDTLEINSGDSSPPPVSTLFTYAFLPATMVNVETLVLDDWASYNITLADANVAAGQTLTVDGSRMGSDVTVDTLTFNGSAETDGRFVLLGGTRNDSLTGGAGDDSLKGGAGNDDLNGGAGADTAVYSGARSDYAVHDLGGGVLQLVDTRAGAPDGSDTIRNIEFVSFSGGTMAVAQLLDTPPTGSVAIAGAATEDQVLTANASSLADVDGLGTLHYHWQRDGGRGFVDVGADQATYTLGDGDVGTHVRVVVSYTDGRGVAESVASPATAAVANVNDAPTGGVTIAGTPTQNQLLTASNTLADDDGMGTLHYQWQRDVGGSFVNVGGDQATYTPVAGDVGYAVRVVVSYTDQHGTAESVASAETTTIAIGVRATQVVLDTPDLNPWASLTTTFDAQDSIASQTAVLDNGGRWLSTYDTANASPELWDAKQYDAADNLLQQTVTNDDGTHTLTIYDVANAYGWASATIGFDADWNRVSLTATRDDGSHGIGAAEVAPAFDALSWFKTPYDPNFAAAPTDPGLAGIPSDRWVNTFDTANTSSELWDTRHYDAADNLLQQTVTYDDGTHALTLYDVANAYGWASATIGFDANWNRVSLTATRDDGSHGIGAGEVASALDLLQWYTTPYGTDPKSAVLDTILTGGAGSDVLYGFAGNDVLDGKAGNDVIAGGQGNDVLTGGTGDDRFVFNSGDGQDTVTDFTPGDAAGDIVELHGYGIANFAALLPFMSQAGADTIIVFDSQNHITLHNVTLAQLNAGDFVFG
ncbi:MAG TPA: hypothetical protein VII56_06655 [Rhizomicrobium sp.]